MSEPDKNAKEPTESPKENNAQNPKPEQESQIGHISPFTRTIIDIHDLDKYLKPELNHGVCGGHNLGLLVL